MGNATGLTFEQWVDRRRGSNFALKFFLDHQDNVDVIRRNAEKTGTECAFTVPERIVTDNKNNVIKTIPEQRFEYTIFDHQHSFASPDGNNSFRRFACLVGVYVSKGGDVSTAKWPVPDEDDED